MAASASIQIDELALQKLEAVDVRLRQQVGRHCMKAMAPPVAERMQLLSPSSRLSGSRGPNGTKWGRNATAKFTGRASMMQHDSGEHMGFRVPAYMNATAYIGANWGPGNKQQFNNSPKGRRVFYWGKDMHRVRQTASPNFLQQAWRETQTQAVILFVAELEKRKGELFHG